MKLTEKQKRFADEYIQSGNATQSAIRAGYSRKTARSMGQENLTKPDIKNYINERMKDVNEDGILTAKQVMKRYSDIVTGKLKETVVVGTPFGAESVEKTADFKTQISAMKEIMKRYPDNDKVMEQQLRKLTAEADIAEAQAKRELSDEQNSSIEVSIVMPEQEDSNDE
ncbi:terminase small subunit [Weissella paramesenteroides]|uniref:terminase small subunit n=1 Tax=Weissella paramesenteroides TaxID=1249 RepID=UPI003981F58D